METAYIGLGANLGEPLVQLATACELLDARHPIVKKSPIYLSKPVGNVDQADFYNRVVAVACSSTPEILLQDLLAIEKRLGRVRGEKNGPRPIDLDILFFGTEIINTPQLQIPHPRLHERDFVLVPLTDLQADLQHPLFHRSIEDLYKELQNFAIVRQVSRD